MLKIVRMPTSRRSGAANRMAGWNDGANMKPTPASSMHRATALGSRTIVTPSASRTSAEPLLLVIPRFPCLATGTPAPAVMNAAAVETLKLPLPSPPVPHVSTTGKSVGTLRTFSRIVRAMPATSSAVSPFMRSAVTKAPNCAAVARSSMMSAITVAA